MQHGDRDIPRLDLFSFALFRSGLHLLGRALVEEGTEETLAQATTLFRSLPDAYDAICSQCFVEQHAQSLMLMHLTLIRSAAGLRRSVDQEYWWDPHPSSSVSSGQSRRSPAPSSASSSSFFYVDESIGMD